jgi:hypothetical protein
LVAQLPPTDGEVARRADAKAHPIAVDPENNDLDLLVDNDAFVITAGEN